MNLAGLFLMGMLATVQTPPARTHLVIITGLGGAPEFSELFHDLALRFADAAHSRHGIARSSIHYLAEKPDRNPDRVQGGSRRDQIEKTLMGLAESAGTDDRVLVVLIGHGSFDEEVAKFNLPGPDMSASDFAGLIDMFGARTVALVNCTSSSGPFVEALSGQGRIIITATRSGRERNETVFARFFVEAFTGDGSDLDKDKRVSLLEAFEYARRLTSDHYERGEHILTEHALLDDNGDGEGSGTIDLEQGDGFLARSFFLEVDPYAAAAADSVRATNPELAALYQKRQEIQGRIETHRARKNEMDPDEYMQQLEQLLLELARTNQEIRRRGGVV